MPNALQRLFLPLYRLTHWPDAAAYQREIRLWSLTRLLATIDTSRIKTVVEVGCGDGWVSHELAQRFAQVVAFDINEARIQPPRAANLLLVSASAEAPPIAPHSADLVISMEMIEHIIDRKRVLKLLMQMARPGAPVLITVPTSPWKILQVIGFIPDWIRKQIRGLTRAMAGQRKVRPPARPGFKSNNPFRENRKPAWYRKLVLPVHGEYAGNWEEYRQWSIPKWESLFQEAGFRIIGRIGLGLHSPYFFGFRCPARTLMRLGWNSGGGWVLLAADTPMEASSTPAVQ